MTTKHGALALMAALGGGLLAVPASVEGSTYARPTITSITFRYTASVSSGSTCGNLQGDSAGVAALSLPLPYNGSVITTPATPATTYQLGGGGLFDVFTINPDSGSFPVNTSVALRDLGGAVLAELFLDTSCSYPIHAGDAFGFLRVVSMEVTDPNNGSISTGYSEDGLPGCGGFWGPGCDADDNDTDDAAADDTDDYDAADAEYDDIDDTTESYGTSHVGEAQSSAGSDSSSSSSSSSSSTRKGMGSKGMGSKSMGSKSMGSRGSKGSMGRSMGMGGGRHAKISSITFSYNGVGIGGCDNLQGAPSSRGKWGLALYAPHWTPLVADAIITSSVSSTVYRPGQRNGSFTVAPRRGKFSASTCFTLRGASGYVVSEVFLHTSCSYPIHVGDSFGFLTVVAMTTTAGWPYDSTGQPGCGGSTGDACTSSPTAASGQNRLPDLEPSAATASSLAPTVPASSTQAPVTRPPASLPPTPTPPDVTPPRQPAASTAVGHTPRVTGEPRQVTGEMTTSVASTIGPGSTDPSAPGWCAIDVHPVGSVDPVSRTCSSVAIETIELNTSVGYITQTCNTHDTDAGGGFNTLYVTIQPVCKATDNEPQRWTICSWQPDEQSPICAISGLECCKPVSEYTPPDLGSSLNMACREYGEGDCDTLYGFDGAAVVEYAIKLTQCFGDAPLDPLCRPGSSLAADRASVAATHTLAIGSLGAGIVLLSLALYTRRMRRQAALFGLSPETEGTPLLETITEDLAEDAPSRGAIE